MGKTLVAGATVLTMAPEQPEPFNGYLLFDDSGILEVAPGRYSGDLDGLEVIDARGLVLMPGFVSGHNHLWQSAFRGIASDGELHPWLQALHWTYGNDFSDGDFYAFTLQGALDQLQHGITTTYNHSQRLGGTEAQYLESLQASLDAGQHFVFAYNANLSQSDDAIREDVAGLVERAASLPEDTPLLDLSLNSVGAYTSEEKFALEMALAQKYGLTVQIHYLEQYQRRKMEREEWPSFKRAGRWRTMCPTPILFTPPTRFFKTLRLPVVAWCGTRCPTGAWLRGWRISLGIWRWGLLWGWAWMARPARILRTPLRTCVWACMPCECAIGMLR